MLNRPFFLLLITLLTTQAQADVIEQHHAHVHGVMTMTLVEEAGRLEMVLQSPAMNLFGFEHEAHTQEQQQVMKDTRQKLEKTEALFVFSGAHCSIVQQDIDFLSLEHDNETEGSDGHLHEGDAHADIEVTYRYQCDQSPTGLDLKLMDIFMGIHQLDLMWLIDDKQGFISLTGEQRQVKF